MATIGNSVLTLNDWAKRLDPNGKTDMTVELLSETNEVLDDMLWKEGNLPTGERTTIRTGLPTTYWRAINQGIPSSKSTTAQVDESCAMLAAYSEVDADLAELNGNVNQFRLNEAQAFLESMNQEQASTLFYGSAANPEEFVGFSNRYNDLAANNAQNIIDAGGTGADNSSIWLVGWGQNTVHGVFPKGSKAGIDHQDKGQVTLETTAGVAGNRMEAYRDYWTWKSGLVVKDWRYAVRIANIDISVLIADNDGSTTNILELMLKALHRLPSMSNVKPVFYANRTITQMLDIQAMNKSNLQLNAGMEEGKRKVTLRGVPIRTVDALTEAEAQVT
jgi:hypothetical protein